MKKLLSLVTILALLGTGTALAKDAATQKAAPASKTESVAAEAAKPAEQVEEKAPEAAPAEPAAEEAAKQPEAEKK